MTTHLSKDVYEKLVGKSIDIKQNKYKNKKIEYDGILWDSKKEMSYYIKFKLMEKSGEISELKRQVKYELQPKYQFKGKSIRQILYIADFTYKKNGIIHVIDVKGYRNEIYKLKKKIFEYKYGIEIEEM